MHFFRTVPQEDPSDKEKQQAAAQPVEPDEISRPICYAELSAFMLNTLGFLLCVAGLGFWTVNPPGEVDLCTVEVLGLVNSTESEQATTLASCHMLYTVVFNSLKGISAPFIICGFVSLVTGYIVARGACHKSEEVTPGWFKCAMLFDLVGMLLSGATAIPFAGIWAVVAAGLAPIHAYCLVIMVSHAAVGIANYTSGSNNNMSADDDNVRTAAEVYTILYTGYLACNRVELCLTIGTLCLWGLGGVYVFDILRNGCATHGCFRPVYGEKMRQGSHLRHWWHRCRDEREAAAAARADAAAAAGTAPLASSS